MADSLSKKISDILNCAPVSFDPEDDGDDTTARVKYIHDEDDNESEDELNLSKFRKQNVELLEQVDQRYLGKKATRKSFCDESQSEEIEEIEEAEDESDSLDTESDDEGEEEESSECGSTNDEENQSYFDNNDIETKVFSGTDSSEFLHQANKSSSVRQQLSIWENLLEMRIKMQKCLHTSNKLPQTTHFKKLQSNSEEFSEQIKETKSHVQHLLNKFLHLQILLLKKYPETKKILIEGEGKVENQSDEAITSDTDEEDVKNDYDTEDVPQKKLKLGEYKNELSRRFDLYRSYRNSVLQKWHDKTRISSNKSENVHTIAQQINHVLSNKNKLIKATQLKRTDYSILGISEENDETSDIYNSNIYDDTDFYHHLLRELIEFKSADLTDPIKLSRQWVQLQKLRTKMKKKVDTKATKGRKIRYVVHPKLVNFMGPVEEQTWQESAKTELYNSLFCKNRPCKVI